MKEGRSGTMLIASALVLCALGSAPARGDVLPNGMRIVRGKGKVADHLVFAPPLSGVVPLPDGGVSALDSVRYDRATQKVTISYLTRCEQAASVSLPLSVLEARAENGAGMVALGQHRYADAAARFARAGALEPTFYVARTNLASARMRAKDREGALNALGSLVAEAPVWLYAKVLTDPDLAPLIDAPPIAALRARQAGNAKLAEKDRSHLSGYVATAPGLVVAGNEESSWGADCGSNYQLLVFDTKDGRLLTTMSLGGVVEGESPCKPTPGRARDLAAANRLLADLGFMPPVDRETGVTSFDEDRGVGKAYFAQARFGLVQGDKALRLLAGDRELARYDVLLGKLSFAQRLPASKVLVVGWERPAREGCEDVDPRGVLVLPLPASKTTP
jgi:hypothetical protein